MSASVLQIIENAMNNWQPPEVPEDIPPGGYARRQGVDWAPVHRKSHGGFRAALPMLKEALEANPALPKP